MRIQWGGQVSSLPCLKLPQCPDQNSGTGGNKNGRWGRWWWDWVVAGPCAECKSDSNGIFQGSSCHTLTQTFWLEEKAQARAGQALLPRLHSLHPSKGGLHVLAVFVLESLSLIRWSAEVDQKATSGCVRCSWTPFKWQSLRQIFTLHVFIMGRLVRVAESFCHSSYQAWLWGCTDAVPYTNSLAVAHSAHVCLQVLRRPDSRINPSRIDNVTMHLG